MYLRSQQVFKIKQIKQIKGNKSIKFIKMSSTKNIFKNKFIIFKKT